MKLLGAVNIFSYYMRTSETEDHDVHLAEAIFFFL